MKWAKKYFKSFNITHAYRSTYSVGNFTTNLMYLQDLNTFGQPRDPAIDTMDFRPMNQIAAVTISEQFAPLLGLDFTLVNSLSGRIEYRKTRALSLSLVNTRLTENLSEEFTMGLGYRIAKPRFGFLFNGKPLPNSINFRFDFSIRDNIQIARDLDGKLSQPLGGIRTVSLRPNAEYQVNNRVTIRLFLDRMVNKPYTSLSFPSYNTRGGLSVRFSLAK